MSKKFLFINLCGASFLIAGTILLVLIIRSHAVNIVSTPPRHVAVKQTAPAPAAAPTAASAPIGYIAGEPTNIKIPSLGIDLPVIPGYYDASSQTWTLTTTKVQFATITSQPNNQSGNTFMYGHARTNIFGKLPRLSAGAVAIVNTSNGHAFYYTLASTKVVSPEDSDAAIGGSDKPVLTLQTCVGLLYQSRELLTFNLVRTV